MNLRAIRLLLKHQGLGWVAYRTRNAIEHKLGTLEKRVPAMPWRAFERTDELVDPTLQTDDEIGAHWRENRRRFLFDPNDRDNVAPLLRASDGEDSEWPKRRLDEIESGKWSYFSNPPAEVGFPPKWNDNLLEGKPGPAMVHFSRIDEFGCGDVKCIWEPNRFGFAFDLVRIYWRTGDERAAELFWTAVEDWYRNNPPNTGINWKCGQESSLRAMAWCFGLWGFADSEHTNDARIATMYLLLAATARRVEAHIDYAVSQRNNHGISEAMGLFTIGTLFPDLPGAESWRTRGRALLESQARELIDDDGGFAQYSANYHRVMLHDYLYAIRIGEVNDAPLSDELKKRVDRAGQFIEQIQDQHTGGVPRYGNDDGALILPLTNCDYDDHRPVVQSVAAMAGRALLWKHGPWDEELLWLGYDDRYLDTRYHDTRYHDAPRRTQTSRSDEVPEGMSRSDEVPADLRTRDAGCHVLRSGGDGMAMLRAGGGRFRPAQLDQLHVDIWHRGINIALDAGTYSYNAEGEWANIPLATTAAHNTIMIDGTEQAERISRFLFLPPPVANVERFERSPGGHIAIAEATLDVYQRLPDPVAIRRSLVRLGDDHWLVIDAVEARQPHEISIAWNLPDAEHQWAADAQCLTLILADPDNPVYTVAVASNDPGLECAIVRGEDNDWRGWRADRYHALKRCLRIEATLKAPQTIIATAFGPGIAKLDATAERIAATLRDHSATIKLANERIASITLDGPQSEIFTLN